MRQGRKLLSVCAALAMLIAAAPLAHSAAAGSANAPRPVATAKTKAAKSKAPGKAAKSRRSLRQFTGVVTAFDNSSITVEKGGKKPKTMVFARDAEMKTTGELEEDVRVTVYYRQEGDRAVAQRVVVKHLAPESDES
jgi:hypothetical protein